MDSLSTSQKQIARRLIIVAVAICVVVASWFLYREFFTFYLKNTYPSTGNVATSTPYIKLNFNKAVTDDFTVSLAQKEGVSAENIVREISADGRTITIYTQGLLQEQPYIIDIQKVVSTDGKEIADKKIEFTPKSVEFDDLPQAIRDDILLLQDQLSHSATADPVFSLLPHSTSTYHIDASVGSVGNPPKDITTLIVTLKLSVADLGTRSARVAEYKKQALDYLKSLEINLDDYLIEYIISSPPTRPTDV